MNTELCDYIIKLYNKHNFIKDWISHKYKEKSLCIYGNPGTGKSTLANYILKNWTKIYIRSDFCKNGILLDNFLKESLYKKSITMMFGTNIYKALIIDDIFYIHNNDKKLFKSIINFSKKEIKNHPIVYILNTINHKDFKLIIKKSYPFKIDLSGQQLIDITKKYLLQNKSFSNNIIKELVQKSNNNLHNIKVNISFYKNKFNNINQFDTYDDELSEHIKNMFRKNTILELYNNAYTDYNIIGLNILENLPDWIRPLETKIKNITLDEIYHLYSISELYSNNIHEHNNWDYIEHIITCNIVSPIILLRLNKIEITKVDYNKYISKSIIYIHNCKLLNQNNLDTNILYFLYNMLNTYYNFNIPILKKKELEDKIIQYINYYNIPINISDKFLKFFLKDIEKKDIKRFYTKIMF